MADRTLRKIPLVFYRNWLRGLNEPDRNAIGQDLMRDQYR
jgi:hypothetical protein